MHPLRRWTRRARREPGATLTTVLVLALGIATNIVVFQCIDRLVLNPLPLPNAAEIVVIGSEMPAIEQPLEFFEPLSGPELDRLRAATRTLRAVVPFDLNSVRLLGAEYPVRLFGAFVWGDPAPLLGVEPSLGRSFSDDEIEGGAGVALLSDGAWRRDFGADETVIGRSIDLDGVPHTVIGVLPPYATIYGVEVWVPSPDAPATLDRSRRQFNLLARVAPGLGLDEVNRELSDLAAAIERDWSDERAYEGWALRARPFAQGNAFAYADEAALTLAASVMVLLLICVNLGNLQLVRGVQGRGEVATHLALGGSRARLRVGALVEAAALGLAGCAGALVLAWAAFGALNRTLPGVLQPLGPPLGLQAAGVAFGVVAGVAAVGLLAVAGMLSTSGVGPREVVGGARGHGSRGLRRLQRALVAAQLALGLALASGAGAVATAVARVLTQDPGFAADHLVSMRLSLPSDVYAGEGVPAFFRGLVDEVAGVPGVERAAIASQVAPSTVFTAEVSVEGTADDVGARIHHTVVSPGYFEAMGIATVAGRPFDGRDRAGSAPVVVLNEAAAERFFPGGTPLGERVRVRGTNFDSGWAEVVGVSRAIRNQGQGDPAAAEVFTVHEQAGERYRQMFLVVRATDDPAALVPAVRGAVQRLDPAQPVYGVGTARGTLRAQVAPRRTAAHLLVAVAVLAVALAALGLHGVLGYTVATRRGELAVRAALGAGPGDLGRVLLVDVLGLVAGGLGAGVALTVWLGWSLRAALGEAAGWNGTVVAGAAGVLVAAALLATVRPARRASTTPPADALRTGG